MPQEPGTTPTPAGTNLDLAASLEHHIRTDEALDARRANSRRDKLVAAVIAKGTRAAKRRAAVAARMPFAGGLMAHHPERAATPDEGLVGVSPALAEEDTRLLKEGYWFDYAEANRVCRWLETCCVHSSGSLRGQPITLAPWQRRFVRRLVGWYRPSGIRRYDEAFLLLPRGAGKTELVAWLSLYFGGADGIGPMVMMAATSQDQARILYDSCRNVIDQQPELQRHYEPMTTVIVCHRTGGLIRLLTGKARDGDRPTHGIVEEYHEHRTTAVYDSLKTGLGKSPEGLLIVITTAGFDIDGPCYRRFDHLRKVVEGIVPSPHTLPLLWHLEPDDDWTDPEVWPLVQPGLGVSVSREKYYDECREAMDFSDYQQAFRTKRLNTWMHAAKTFLNMERWKDCAGKIPKDLDGLLDYYAKLGHPKPTAYGGLDLAMSQDLCALAAVVPWPTPPEQHEAWYKGVRRGKLPKDVGEGVDVWCRFYMPEELLAAKQKADGVPYSRWREMGILVATPGDVTDYGFIRQDILKLHSRFDLQSLCYDKQFASQFATELLNDNGVPMVEFPQTYDFYTQPMRQLQSLVIRRLIRHGGNPLLTWTASNMVSKIGAKGGVMPNKAKSRGRIDGVVAALMALARANLAAKDRSVYESRGIISL
jgi:phage terminase large subunit-like protein